MEYIQTEMPNGRQTTNEHDIAAVRSIMLWGGSSSELMCDGQTSNFKSRLKCGYSLSFCKKE